MIKIYSWHERRLLNLVKHNYVLFCSYTLQKEISTKFTSPHKQVAEVCDYIVMFRNKWSAMNSFVSNHELT